MPSLSNELITWPNIQQFGKIANAFAQNSGFPSLVCGAIDSRENPILMPKQFPDSYFNRKGFYSIKIQAICDNRGKFLDVFVGWPGKSHDARAFRNSSIFNKLERGDALPPDCFILGDSAYPVKQ